MKMSMYEVFKKIEEIAISHESINYTQIGHDYDISSKQEKYMSFWIETPVQVSYLRSETKQYSFSINVLTTARYDDLDDIMDKTSDAENVGDDIIHYIVDVMKDHKIMVSYDNINAITLRHYTTNDLVGVKYDIQFNLQSNYRCYKENIR